MLQKLLLITLTLFSLTASAQWQQTGSKVRYVNGLGIPTKDTVAGVAADSSQIVIRPADSALYIKYKRTWLRVGGGGGSIAGSGTTNYIPKFTSSTAIGNSQIFDNGTNVGIGTITPSYKLNLSFTQSSNTFQGFNINATTLTKSYGIWSANSVSGGLYGLTNPFTGFVHYTDAAATSYINDGSGYFSWHNSSAELMRLTNAGNVGIGTTSPNSRLDVDKGSQSAGSTTPLGALLVANRAAGNGILELGVNASAVSWLQSRNSTNATYYDLALQPSGGNVGIGYTAPAAKLAVSGTTLINTNTDNGVDALQVQGSISGIGFKQNYVAKTGAYTATNADYVIDCTSGSFTITLYAASGNAGRILIVKNSGAGSITLDGNASETIDGSTTFSLLVQYDVVQIMCDGTNWKIISKL